jgi:hypothetical protein
MKRNFSTNNKFLVVVFLIATACNGIFIPDPIDPRIPKYTEEGNNVAGAFFNDKIWNSVVKAGFNQVSDRPYITVWSEKDSLSLRLTGRISEESSSIEFHLKGLKITKFADLLVLNGQKIQLDGINTAGYFIRNYTPEDYAHKGTGQIYFRNVKTEDTSGKIILSGTFSLSFIDWNGNILKVTSGRFDYRISEQSNFNILN